MHVMKIILRKVLLAISMHVKIDNDTRFGGGGLFQMLCEG